MATNHLFLWSSVDAFIRNTLLQNPEYSPFASNADILRAKREEMSKNPLDDQFSTTYRNLKFFDRILYNAFGDDVVKIMYIPTAVLHKCGSEETKARYQKGEQRDMAIIDKVPRTIEALKILFRKSDKDAVIHPVHLYDESLEFCNKCDSQTTSCSDKETLKNVFDQAIKGQSDVSKLRLIPADKNSPAALDDLVKDKGINMVFFHGGEVHWLSRILRLSGIEAWIKSNPGIAYGGFSAGSIVAGMSTEVSAIKHTFSDQTLFSNVDEIESAGCEAKSGDFQMCDTSALGLYQGLVVPHVSKNQKDKFWEPLITGKLKKHMSSTKLPMIFINDDHFVHIGKDRIDTIVSEYKGLRYPRSYYVPVPARMRLWWLAASFPVGSLLRLAWNSRVFSVVVNVAVLVCLSVMVYDIVYTVRKNKNKRLIEIGVTTLDGKQSKISPHSPVKWPIALVLLMLGVTIEVIRSVVQSFIG